MTALERPHRGIRRRMPGRLAALSYQVLAASLGLALMLSAIEPSRAAADDLITIAVFDFELHDMSAGGGIHAPDAIDAENLRHSTEDARRMLAESDRFRLVEVGDIAGEAIPAGGIRHCNGCEARLGRELGADQSMIGVFTRISRTEYTLQILVRDTRTGAVVSNAFTGLRMGTNSSWPRSVKWLMSNRILSAERAE